MAHRRHSTLASLAEARSALLAAAAPLAALERVAVEEALGRVTAEAVLAGESVPHYQGAAMDGIALRAADTAGASEASPVVLEHGTPETAARPFSRVDTGNALPAWADAVVMIERVYAGPPPLARATDAEATTRPDAPPAAAQARGTTPAVVGRADVAAAPLAGASDDCCAADDDAPPGVATSESAPTSAAASGSLPSRADATARVVHVRAAARPWQHVRLVGEDVVAGELLLPRGHAIRAHDVGALLAAGIVEVPVRPRPVVAIVPTGDELIEPGEVRRPGRIVEFNSRMIAAFVAEWGGEARRLAPVGDNLDAVRSRVALAARDADVVCVIAGSSAGEHDFTADALASLGTVLAPGIAVMPGKPAIVARLDARDGTSRRARVALGIPGYPVSAAVICRELLAPLLAHLSGTAPAAPPTLRAVTPGRLASRPGQEELLRVTLGEVGGRMVATPLARGAGAITSMVRADGIVRLGPQVEVVEAGAEVEVELLRPAAAVRGTIVLAGSHDPALVLLEDVLRARAPHFGVAMRSVGSLAGLAALERDEVHGAVVRRAPAASAAAPADAISQAMARLATRLAVVTRHLVRRRVGLIVAPGNPLALRAAADLLRPGVRLPPEVERSAVRLLDPTVAVVAGAERRDAATRNAFGALEMTALEMTPLAVAAAVRSGLADAGLGTAAAAAALGLDFVPLAEEEWLLVLRGDFACAPAGEALLDALGAPELRVAIDRLAGDDAVRAGACDAASRD